MIKVLAKTDTILRTVAARPGIAFGDLVASLGIHKATLSNLLKTLTDLGYTERDDAGRCYLGPTLISLAAGERRRRSLPALAEECARNVAETLREVVTVGMLIHGDRFNLAKASVERTVSVNAGFEIRPSPYDTATGRTLLAFSGDREVEEVIGRHGLPGEAWDDIRTPELLHRSLRQIRDAGHAEVTRGDAHSLAVPVLDPGGTLIAAVGVAVPSYRLTPARRTDALATLHRAADHMSRRLDSD
jgi:DNA-binding IclR family transcriptional regulator